MGVMYHAYIELTRSESKENIAMDATERTVPSDPTGHKLSAVENS
jgi:hypothetical protein